jgi:flagellar biosynthesis/type III secretory pathway chaperone
MRDMEALWEKLIDILEQEGALYRDILELSRHKTETIVEGKVTTLEQLTGVEHKMVMNAGRLEQQREETVNQLAESLKIKPEQLNFSLVIKKTEGNIRDRFLSYRDEIAVTLKELKEVNDLNSHLIKKSLEYIDFSINLIAGSSSEVTYHDKKDGKGKDKGASFFDKKV